MTDPHSIVAKGAASPPAPSMNIPRNWRSELGTFWRDIEEAGSLAKAIRLRSSTKSVRNNDGAISRFAGEEGPIKTSRWAHFRTLCTGIF